MQNDLENFKNLPNIKTEPGELGKVESLDRQFLIDNINNLEDKRRQKEDFIAVQAKAIVALELDICEKDDLINSLKSDLDLKEKDSMIQKKGLLQIKEKNEMLKFAEQREKELKERIEQKEKELQENMKETSKELNKNVEENEKEIRSKDKIIFDLKLKATESEDQLINLKNNIKEKEVAISKIMNEREEYENKYSKVQDFSDTLKQENEYLNTENKDLKHWKDKEAEKLRSSLKLRLKTMIEKNLAKDNLYKQKIISLENLLNEKR